MKVVDAMTAPVVTVAPDTPLKTAAALMLEHRISGLPVVADGRVLGVLSETDILYKERAAPTRQGLVDWVVHYGDDPPTAKLQARTAGEAMTAPAVTVPPWRSLAGVAAMLLDLGIDRLPVVDGDELVGIVTRSDLVRAFTRTDEQIEEEIRSEVLVRVAWLGQDAVSVSVMDGVVTLEGEVETESVAEVIEAEARRVPGVVSLESRLSSPERPVLGVTAQQAAGS
jgi:CBS domain-containing protein